MKMYTPDGAEAFVVPSQVATLLEAGWTLDKSMGGRFEKVPAQEGQEPAQEELTEDESAQDEEDAHLVKKRRIVKPKE